MGCHGVPHCHAVTTVVCVSVLPQERAACLYVLLDGSVSLYAKPSADDDSGDVVPLDWTVVRHRLDAVQDSLNAIKQLARVPHALPVKKGGAGVAAGPTDAGIVADAPVRESVVVRTRGDTLDTRQTWGRLLGGVQLAGVVANVTEEFEKLGHASAHRKRVGSAKAGGEVLIDTVLPGQSFGEQGLTLRRPGIVTPQ